MFPSSGHREGVLDLDRDSQFTIIGPPSFDRPQLCLSTSVCSSLYVLTCARCAQCSPSIPLWLASYLLASAGGRTQLLDCALCILVCNHHHHIIGQELVFFSYLYIKHFELGVEVALYH